MRTFNEFDGTPDAGNEVLDETTYGKSRWVKTAAIGLQIRVNTLSNAVKSSKDIGQKLDLMADLIRANAYISTLSIATNVNDRSLLKMKGNK